MLSRDVKQELELTLTRVARSEAKKHDLPFARSIRFVEDMEPDLRVPRDSRQIYLSASVDHDSIPEILERAVRQAARIDFDILSPEDAKRLLRHADKAVSQLAWWVVKATRQRDFEKAEQYMAQLQDSIWRLERTVEKVSQ